MVTHESSKRFQQTSTCRLAHAIQKTIG